MATNAIDKSFKQLYGKLCWGVFYDRNTNLHLNFGPPFLTIREPFQSKSKSPSVRELFARRLVSVNGKWRLWVFVATWEISFDGKRAASNLSKYRKIKKATAKLNGQKLTKVEIDAETGTTKFEFDLGGILEVRRWKKKSKDDLWILYKPNGYTLVVKGNGRYSHQHDNSPDEESLPLPSSQ